MCARHACSNTCSCVHCAHFSCSYCLLKHKCVQRKKNCIRSNFNSNATTIFFNCFCVSLLLIWMHHIFRMCVCVCELRINIAKRFVQICRTRECKYNTITNSIWTMYLPICCCCWCVMYFCSQIKKARCNGLMRLLSSVLEFHFHFHLNTSATQKSIHIQRTQSRTLAIECEQTHQMK